MQYEFMPFYVGQKVVAIKNQPNSRFKKGDEFVIRAIKKDCCFHSVDIGIRDKSVDILCCSKCNALERVYDGVMWYAATLFAPIEQAFQSITFEEVIKIESPLIGIN